MARRSERDRRAAIGAATRFFRNRLFRKIVLEDSKDFPFVPVGIADPRLVLQRVATLCFHFVARKQTPFPARKGQDISDSTGICRRNAPCPASVPSRSVKAEWRIRNITFAYPFVFCRAN